MFLPRLFCALTVVGFILVGCGQTEKLYTVSSSPLNDVVVHESNDGLEIGEISQNLSDDPTEVSSSEPATSSDEPKSNSPTVVSDPSPTVVPNPSPTVVPNPSPTVVPDPSPTVVPNPSPTVVPNPSPTVVPNPSPTVVPNPSPTPTRTPVCVCIPVVVNEEELVRKKLHKHKRGDHSECTHKKKPQNNSRKVDGSDDSINAENASSGCVCPGPQVGNEIVTVEIVRKNCNYGRKKHSHGVASIVVASFPKPESREVERVLIELAKLKLAFRTGWGNMVLAVTSCVDSNSDKSCLSEQMATVHFQEKLSLLKKKHRDSIKVEVDLLEVNLDIIRDHQKH